MTLAERLLLPHALAVAPYRLVEEAGDVKLSQNESPFDVPPDVKEEVFRRLRERPWNRYAQQVPNRVVELLAAQNDWPPDGIVLGGGSNLLLEMIAFAALLLLALRLDQRAAQYPDSILVSSHSNYRGLPTQFRWDHAYRTSDSFTSVYNWYSTTFDLGAESRANGNCIYLEGTRRQFMVERHTSVFLCTTPSQQLIYVARFTSFQ